MKKSGFFAFYFAVLAAVNLSAQRPVPIPVPAAELEIREGSIRIRSNELERIKRDSYKLPPKADGKEQAMRFAMIKEDFENIQKSQNLIIKAYMTGKNINFAKISDGAHDIKKNAHRLAVNLFNDDFDIATFERKNDSKKLKNVKDLIVELDNVLGVFVKNPIFQDVKIVDPASSEKAQTDLRKISKLSDELFKAASKMK